MKNFLVLTMLFALTGCVTTKTTGFVDPEYKENAYQISSVIVRAEGATLEEAQLAEQRLVEKFNELGVHATKFMDIVPPTRNYKDEKIARLLVKSGADSVFTVYVADKATIESYVPPTYHPGTSTSYVNTIGNTAYVNTYTSPGYTSGGYSISKPSMLTFSSLVDLSNGNNIWQAEGESNGSAFASFSDLVVSAGLDAIADMKDKGLIPITEATEE